MGYDDEVTFKNEIDERKTSLALHGQGAFKYS